MTVHKLRAVRVPSSRRVEKQVAWQRGGTAERGAVVDLSAGGLAFETRTAIGLRAGDTLDRVEVSFAGRLVYAGPATISSVREEGGRTVVGLAIAERWLPLASAVNLDDCARLEEELDEEMKRLARVAELPPVLKAAVAETRYFLEGLRRKLEDVDARLSRLPQRSTERLAHAALRATVGPVAERLGTFARRLADIAAHRSSIEQDVFRRYVQIEVGPLLREAPLMRRVLEKPLGHALDFETVALAGRGPVGPTLFARALEQFVCSVGPARSLARRTEDLAAILANEATRFGGRTVRVLAVGAGAGAELAAFLRRSGIVRAEVTLVDGDAGALLAAQETLADLREQMWIEIDARLVQLPPMELLAESSPHQLLGEHDLVYLPTLLDLTSDRAAARLLNLFATCLGEAGGLIGATLVRDDETRFLFELVAEWFLVYRDAGAIGRLGAQLPSGFEHQLHVGEEGLNRYLVVRKR